MFTGIVEERGRAASVAPGPTGTRLVIESRTVAADAEPGASVSVNGVCLTVVERVRNTLAFDLTSETLLRSTLGSLAPGDPVNLERPATLSTRLGGHLLQGHVDGMATVERVESEAGGTTLRVSLNHGLARYLVEKGSIAVDGVSLTVASIDDEGFTVALVPYTLVATTLGEVRPGDRVNIEVDILAKYVERLARRGS